MVHALIVDDDAELRTLVSDYLKRYGMRVTAVADGAAFRRTLPSGLPGATDPFDVLLLDLMLPDANGLDLCRWVREKKSTLPIIMLTAQGDPASRIVGLELGADDYLPKPFEPRELVARINAVLRRSGAARAASPAEKAPVQRFEGWVFDRLGRQLTSPKNVMVALSSAEFRLLSAFADNPRRVLSRERLLDLSHSPGVDVTDRAVDLAVSRLRQKLGDAAAIIRTVRGEGYVFDADPKA